MSTMCSVNCAIRKKCWGNTLHVQKKLGNCSGLITFYFSIIIYINMNNMSIHLAVVSMCVYFKHLWFKIDVHLHVLKTYGINRKRLPSN